MTETYACLTRLGVMNGYCVIPEFQIPADEQKNNRIDLVFAKKQEVIQHNQITTNLDIWEVHYAIEIDGVDVPVNTFYRHAENYAYLSQHQANGIFRKGINILYYHAYHRNWINQFIEDWQHHWGKRKAAYERIALNQPFTMEIHLSEYYQLPVILGDDCLFNW